MVQWRRLLLDQCTARIVNHAEASVGPSKHTGSQVICPQICINLLRHSNINNKRRLVCIRFAVYSVETQWYKVLSKNNSSVGRSEEIKHNSWQWYLKKLCQKITCTYSEWWKRKDICLLIVWQKRVMLSALTRFQTHVQCHFTKIKWFKLYIWHVLHLKEAETSKSVLNKLGYVCFLKDSEVAGLCLLYSQWVCWPVAV